MRTLILVPTYNERSNIRELVAGLHRHAPQALVLVVDDSSPDGTFEEVRRMMRKDKKLRLLLRDRSVKGRGWAGRDGFLEALRLKANAVVEMDADLSHQPKHLPALLAPILRGTADVVLGSRYIEGGQDMDRPLHRRAVSAFARNYLKWVLGLQVKDPSTGYRAYSKRALESLSVATLKAKDPFTVSEILFRCFRAGLRVVEIPIVFVDRTRGESKLGFSTLLKYLGRAFWLRLHPGFPKAEGRNG